MKPVRRDSIACRRTGMVALHLALSHWCAGAEWRIADRGAVAAGRITGLPKSPRLNFKLENVNIEMRRGFTIHNTQGLSFSNVTVNGELMKPSSLPAGRNAD